MSFLFSRVSLPKLSGAMAPLSVFLGLYIFIVKTIFDNKDFLGREMVIGIFMGITLFFIVVLVGVILIRLGAEASTKGISMVIDKLTPSAQRLVVDRLLVREDKGIIDVTNASTVMPKKSP